jgi:mono/diheme cytochrome c family protein
MGHLRVIAARIGIGDQLAFEITGIKPGEPRGKRAIPFPSQAVTDDTGIRGPRLSPAQRYDLAAGDEAIGRGRGDRRTGREACRRCQEAQGERTGHTALGTGAAPWRFHGRACKARQREDLLAENLRLMLPALALVTACNPAPEPSTDMGAEAAARGRLAIEKVGCASCHTIAGIAWPQGKTGPALTESMAGRALIAGRLENRPDLLAQFVRDAPSLVPETTMPAMPLTEREAYDIAAYLYRTAR